MKSKEIKLKLCPICKKKPRVFEFDDYPTKGRFCVCCLNYKTIGFEHSIQAKAYGKKKAILLWNASIKE